MFLLFCTLPICILVYSSFVVCVLSCHCHSVALGSFCHYNKFLGFKHTWPIKLIHSFIHSFICIALLTIRIVTGTVWVHICDTGYQLIRKYWGLNLLFFSTEAMWIRHKHRVGPTSLHYKCDVVIHFWPPLLAAPKFLFHILFSSKIYMLESHDKLTPPPPHLFF